MNGKKLAIVAVAFAGMLGAGLAEARDRADVQWSISIGHPDPWAGPPVRFYAPPPPVFIDHRSHDRSYYRGAPRRWDRDGDGIPNRYDRVNNPRWDRDGDGVPNRYDRHPRRPG